MTKNRICHIRDYTINLGVPARFASLSGFPLIVRGRKTVGIMVADSSFLSVALPLPVPIGLLPCGLSATIPNAKTALFL